jgi:thiol-disulfide isomerase/thioredoxin
MKPRTLAATLLLAAAMALPAAAQAQELRDITLVDLDGNTHHLSDFRGKWVVVNYWATWCPPCLDEIPELDAFHEAHHEDLAVVVGMNFEDIAEADLRAFVEAQMIAYPIIPTRPAPATPFGPVQGLPTTFLVDPQGRLVARQAGGVTAEDIEAFIANHPVQR